MGLSLREMLFLPPEVDDLAKSVHAMSENHANSADFYRGLVKVSEELSIPVDRLVSGDLRSS